MMITATHPLRCHCGALRGDVTQEGNNTRVVCYCKDCQAFARFLDPAGRVLDAQGGSDVVQLAPHRIHITKGAEHLAVVRLSPQGMLRWYAACCRTPIGNTLARRDRPFTGLLVQCLDSAPLEPSFGPVGAHVNTQSAIGEPKPRAFGLLRTMWTILGMVLGSRLSGRYRNTPFFDADGAPIAIPEVLQADERARLRAAPGGA